MIDDECGAVGGMIIGSGSTRRKPVPVPLYSPRIPHDLTWAGTRAAAVGIGRLTASKLLGFYFVIASQISVTNQLRNVNSFEIIFIYIYEVIGKFPD
jgi:hypothetical protein